MDSAEQRQLLGAFVRARREAISPDGPGWRRRTPGLRREELAARAGIGLSSIAWLEQGRAFNPSATTLARLAGALQLGGAERSYLFELAGRRDPDNPFGQPAADAPASVNAVVSALPWPAYGLDPAWNLCCWNQPARRLLVGIEGDAGHRNLLRWVFTSVAARDLLPDWDERAARILAEFRADYGRNLADPRARAVVEWLLAASPHFAVAWERQAVAGREGGLRRFRHPADGELDFRQHTLRADERADFKVVVLEPVQPRGMMQMGEMVGPAGFEPAT